MSCIAQSLAVVGSDWHGELGIGAGVGVVQPGYGRAKLAQADPLVWVQGFDDVKERVLGGVCPSAAVGSGLKHRGGGIQNYEKLRVRAWLGLSGDHCEGAHQGERRRGKNEESSSAHAANLEYLRSQSQ